MTVFVELVDVKPSGCTMVVVILVLPERAFDH